MTRVYVRLTTTKNIHENKTYSFIVKRTPRVPVAQKMCYSYLDAYGGIKPSEVNNKKSKVPDYPLAPCFA